jgi:histidinol-phosphatase
LTVSTGPPAGGWQDERFRLAWRILDRVDALATAAFHNRSFDTWRKNDGSAVTAVDVRIERLIVNAILAAFPDDVILGEQFGPTAARAPAWIVDPLDGTSNFVEGLPVFAHMLARCDAGEPQFAVVSAPLLGRRWSAYRGCGAFRWGEPISVSGTQRLRDSRLSYGGLRDYDDAAATALLRLARRCQRSRGFGNFLPHLLVAEGTYDLASSGIGCEVWDVAPVALVVREAGGRLTSFDGGNWSGTEPILTSNTVLHDDAIAVLAGREPLIDSPRTHT